MTYQRPPRREFLLRALAACGAPFLAQPGFAQGGQSAPAVDADRAARIASTYLGTGSLEAARRIGEAFLEHLNIERRNDAILEAAKGTLDLIAGAPSSSAAMTVLARTVRTDFTANRFVQLEGWLLSRTELDLCLLTLVPV